MELIVVFTLVTVTVLTVLYSSSSGDSSVASRSTQSSIPLVAHFIYGLWDDTPMPESYEMTLYQWKQHGWKVKLWNRELIEQVMKQYPVWWELYQRLPRPVQKADLARYVLIYQEGGFYFDCDCPPTSLDSPKTLRDELKQHPDWQAVYFVEHRISEAYAQNTTKLFPIRQGVPEQTERLANFAFGAVREHESLWLILETLTKRCGLFNSPKWIQQDYTILFTTGPDVVTEVIQTNRKKWKHLAVLPHTPYMIHTCTGTWRNNQA